MKDYHSNSAGLSKNRTKWVFLSRFDCVKIKSSNDKEMLDCPP